MPREDALVYWIGTSEEEIHFIDSILTTCNGIACVQHEFKLENELTLQIYVALGMEKKFLNLMERLPFAAIQSLAKGRDDKTLSHE